MMEIKNASRVISGGPSILLDSLRILAALVVLFIHILDRWFIVLSHPEYEPGELSHAAVVVFFVLSGFVIAHTTISKNRGGRQYAQARLSRLFSMVVPSLVITALIQIAVTILDPNLMRDYSRGPDWIRYIASGLFINEIWLFSAAPPINEPLWSLSFEFWYYVIFGLWFFRSRSRFSYILPIIALLIAGPKILLMMPIWLAGYAAYILPRPSVNKHTAWWLVSILFFVAFLALRHIPSFPYIIGYKPLYFANQFVTDWIIGMLVAAALWMLPTTQQQSTESKSVKMMRKAADLTFPLYILHFPLMVLWRAIFGYKAEDALQMWEVILSVLLASTLLGLLLEKQRPFWSRLFKRLLRVEAS
ncbi:acyltransferase [Mucilaginibacter terrenus]|uniref:Acyltransferase n=1 Tax=Mucilaginibacter terrenus TaxID=2482727 RepID=A0A3E2NXP2_9SPHI|nr:acyltransferase [Mucilaginibacter terrenus]RFZ85784.1 acyltransferase [Mucilaginibacter terrenus]